MNKIFKKGNRYYPCRAFDGSLTFVFEAVNRALSVAKENVTAICFVFLNLILKAKNASVNEAYTR